MYTALMLFLSAIWADEAQDGRDARADHEQLCIPLRFFGDEQDHEQLCSWVRCRLFLAPTSWFLDLQRVFHQFHSHPKELKTEANYTEVLSNMTLQPRNIQNKENII